LAKARAKWSAKIRWFLLPIFGFCFSAFFGLVHHFYRFAWAGTIFDYGLMLLIAVIFVECLLTAFQ
jgi:hypothetical protein